MPTKTGRGLRQVSRRPSADPRPRSARTATVGVGFASIISGKVVAFTKAAVSWSAMRTPNGPGVAEGIWRSGSFPGMRASVSGRNRKRKAVFSVRDRHAKRKHDIIQNGNGRTTALQDIRHGQEEAIEANASRGMAPTGGDLSPPVCQPCDAPEKRCERVGHDAAS